MIPNLLENRFISIARPEIQRNAASHQQVFEVVATTHVLNHKPALKIAIDECSSLSDN